MKKFTKTTIKTEIENMTVELSNNTGNGTKYVLCIGNKKVYTKGDLTNDNDEFCWLTEKTGLTTEALNNIIMMYKEAEAEAPVEEFEVIKAYPNYYDFDNEDVVNEDLTVPEVESETAPVCTCKFGVLRTRTVTKFINGELVNTVVSYVDDYVPAYYGKFEVIPRFYNYDGSPMESLY